MRVDPRATEGGAQPERLSGAVSDRTLELTLLANQGTGASGFGTQTFNVVQNLNL